MNPFKDARNHVIDQIQSACARVQRDPATVELLAVSKTHPSSAIRDMYELGQRCFGENYLQEALDKIQALKDLNIEWHFIGHVQRNKTKSLAEHFDWVHGVDRLIIAERLSSQRAEYAADLNICLQVNIDHQQTKDGCQPEDVAELVQTISRLPKLKLRGIMVIPAPEHAEAFEAAKTLFDAVKAQHAHPEQWDTLSMGMSADLNAAIAAGSTIVRIGTALFGARDYSQGV
ncbi:YggS family pyridoxal phosphate-dependent enzyme [uncultured Acinetobacter sp.]|uniref:YggS family pyridoxal phosphate-dependent enzyme n=1 Tax=uncultured Acinetobacter sp. TaxID=165433 RepID=UPI0037492754